MKAVIAEKKLVTGDTRRPLTEQYSFSTLYAEEADDSLLSEMSVLFSENYGVWDEDFCRLKGHVRLSPQRLKNDYLTANSCIVLARERACNMLIGYAIAIKKEYEGKGISWITQFVVHSEHQNRGVGKNLLYSLWGESQLDAWGIVTSNPYAIRALEKVTHRRCALQAIKQNKHWLLKFATDSISYVNDTTELIVDDERSVINTNFFVSHADVLDKIRRISQDIPWVLGTLEPGWEWFAFTFKQQPQFALSEEEIRVFLETSNEITKQAYSKMDMKHHSWTKHTELEVDFILAQTNLPARASVLDLGCGTGRHSISFAERQFDVTAVDYNEFGVPEKANLHFLQADARHFATKAKYDLVLCLYDVIGSFADDDDNEAIARTISNCMKDDAYAIISVMNMDYLLARNPRLVQMKSNYNQLFSLVPQSTMEKTGDVFNNDGILIDADTNVCYRREQFKGSHGDLPREFIVRDRRFTMPQIKELLEKCGLQVVFSRYVKAGAWNVDFKADETKEMLLVCKKRSQNA